MRRRGRAAPVMLSALAGILIGAGLVWLLIAREVGGGMGPVPSQPGPATRPPVSAESQDAITKAVERVGPAVVNINTLYRPPSETPMERMMREFMGGPSQPFPREGAGSGIIIDGKRGYVLTNAHVLKGAAEVKVTLSDERSFDARVVGADPLSDVAVVQIKGDDLPEAELGTAADLPIGAWVIAIGNPFGFENSVTVGVLSAKERRIADPRTRVALQDLLQTDASINPGNSGGALVDLSGAVIGIPTAMIPQAQGMGFAVSVDSAKGVFEKLIRTGKMPWLGVVHHYLPPGEAEKLKVPGEKGAMVVEVVPDGPAARAGMKPGDVVLSVAGHAVDGERALGTAVRARDAGDRVDVIIWRDGREMKLQVTLGAVPQEGLR